MCVGTLASPRRATDRTGVTSVKRVFVVLAYIIGVYLVVRAAVELFVIDVRDPATYRDDWGGPSLVGVLAVHCLPGIIVATLMFAALRRRRSAATQRS